MHEDLTRCPAWCDSSHEYYTPRAADRSGVVLHWRALRADWDPSIELAHVTKRNRWTDNGTFISTSPGRFKLRLTPYWADADLDGPDGDILATTIERGRQLIDHLDGGGAR